MFPATRIYETVIVRTLDLKHEKKKIRAEIKDARAQRLHAGVVHSMRLSFR